MNFRKKDGFTLVELMVTILVASIVTVAASALLLTGFRVYNQSARTQKMQNNIRILTTALEDMVSEGTIKEVMTDDEGSWQIMTETRDTVLLYNSPNKAICTQDYMPILMDIEESSVTLDSGRGLLTVTVKTTSGDDFSTTIFCRTGITVDGVVAEASGGNLLDDAQAALNKLTNTKIARTEFLNTLASQYKTRWNTNNIGMILNESGDWTQVYYSEWYFYANPDCYEWYTWGTEWNKETPWCACYISWSLSQMGQVYVKPPTERINDLNVAYWYGNVDEFMSYFQGDAAAYDWISMRDNASAPSPEPGDIIFFDWTNDMVNDPEHVGVVLYTDKGADATDTSDDVIYTIEGNSLGKVAVRQYNKTDTAILGYGILPWVTDAELNGEV